MRYVVFDLETQNTFADVESNDPKDLSISVGCAYDSLTNEYTTVAIDELQKLWPIIEKADVLVGYNSDHFDIPLLNKYYPGDLTKMKSIDIMSSIRESLGRRLKLDSVAQATVGTKKAGNGLMAIKWWREGDIASIKKYCKQDVKVTKEIFEYALTNHKVFYKEGSKKLEIPLNTSNWTAEADRSTTFSLPF
ncbi:ribonuclease H-like domain-containing protein [Candidatus Kaiserbacteria bacterium]|nr:MAG: ribonuclease H-like domain-containing protein [Candidatus Kaiserbacteria bacterium]